MSLTEPNKPTIVYIGDISREGYGQVTKICESIEESSVNLVLYTFGGDPHAAFRIARALQHHFIDGISLFIPAYCKSAGTLIAVGASNLIISDQGELGPLDIQLINPTEMGERSSAMDIMQGIEALKAQALETFKKFAIEVKVENKLSTKISTDVATNLTTGLFGPVFAQIDPLRIGEIQRANYIALHYGKILDGKFANMEPDGIDNLVLGYPSHNFVIDRKEARDIFKNVRAPTAEEIDVIKQIQHNAASIPMVAGVRCFQWIPPTNVNPEDLDTISPDSTEAGAEDFPADHTQDQIPPISNQDTPNEHAHHESNDLPASEGASGSREKSRANSKRSSNKTSSHPNSGNENGDSNESS